MAFVLQLPPLIPHGLIPEYRLSHSFASLEDCRIMTSERKGESSHGLFKIVDGQSMIASFLNNPTRFQDLQLVDHGYSQE